MSPVSSGCAGAMFGKRKIRIKKEKKYLKKENVDMVGLLNASNLLFLYDSWKFTGRSLDCTRDDRERMIGGFGKVSDSRLLRSR